HITHDLRRGARITNVTLISTVNLLLCRPGAEPDLHSFPTRRSSDLGERPVNLPVSATNAPSALSRPSPRAMAVSTSTGAVSLNRDRKSTRLNSSHVKNSYAVFCFKKKNITEQPEGGKHKELGAQNNT